MTARARRRVAAGTSGAVYLAAGLVDAVRTFGGETWLVDLDAANNAPRFDQVVAGNLGEVLLALLR